MYVHAFGGTGEVIDKYTFNTSPPWLHLENKERVERLRICT